MSTIFKDRPEPFSASATATKHPKPKPAPVPVAPKPPGLIKKVLSIFEDENEKLTRQEQELEAKKGQFVQRTREYKVLKRQRDTTALRLMKADEQFANFQANRAQFAASLTRDVWGLEPDLYRSREPWVGYGQLAALDLAIADFPNVRKHIEEELEQAQEKLTAFTSKYGVPSDVE